MHRYKISICPYIVPMLQYNSAGKLILESYKKVSQCTQLHIISLQCYSAYSFAPVLWHHLNIAILALKPFFAISNMQNSQFCNFNKDIQKTNNSCTTGTLGFSLAVYSYLYSTLTTGSAKYRSTVKVKKSRSLV